MGDKPAVCMGSIRIIDPVIDPLTQVSSDRPTIGLLIFVRRFMADRVYGKMPFSIWSNYIDEQFMLLEMSDLPVYHSVTCVCRWCLVADESNAFLYKNRPLYWEGDQDGERLAGPGI